MDIYKLSDEVPDVKPIKGCRHYVRNDVGSDGADFVDGDAKSDCDGTARFVITDLRPAVRNENRVNVYVNGKYMLSLDVAQVVDLGVKVGRVLQWTDLEELKQASEFGKLYQRALEWVLTRPHSVREMRDYLRKRIYEKRLDQKYIDVIVNRLMEKGYLDDRRFAECYVENRFVKKGISEKRLRMELKQKGVASDIIDEVIIGSERDESAEIRKMIVRKRARYRDNAKLIAYICRQGFNYELVRELVAEESSESS